MKQALTAAIIISFQCAGAFAGELNTMSAKDVAATKILSGNAALIIPVANPSVIVTASKARAEDSSQVACYKQAVGLAAGGFGGLNPDGALSLCGGTASADAPIACYKQAVGLPAGGFGGLNPDGALKLCGMRNSGVVKEAAGNKKS